MSNIDPIDVLRSFPGHDQTLSGALASRVARRADQRFLSQDGQHWSWATFARRCERLARAFAARGVQPGDRVAVVGRNDGGHVLALFALARIRAAMVPINPAFGERELRYALDHADVVGVIADGEHLERIGNVFAGQARRPWLLRLGIDEHGPDTLMHLCDHGPDDGPALPDPSPDDTCVMIYTSGTTGFPKCAMHSQRSFVLAGESNVARLHLTPDDRLLIVLPFFHVNALFYSLSGALAAGAGIVVLRRFSASGFWHTVADEGVTVINLIEAMGTMLGARDPSEYRPDHRLRAAYGVRGRALPLFRDRFAVPHLFSGFGMTEVPSVTCNRYGEPIRPGSMGVLGKHPDPGQPWAECRIVDDDERDVPDGTIGELWVRTPIVMQGYFRDPDKTREAFGPDGWFKTGDLVRRDADGFYYHVSRKKDVIRRRGENIAAAEIEMILGEHPAIYEVAALAVPSELGEDDILVAIVPRPGPLPDPRDIVQWCAGRLAAHKLPRYVALRAELPHTPTHKIAKAELRADASLQKDAVDLQA